MLAIQPAGKSGNVGCVSEFVHHKGKGIDMVDRYDRYNLDVAAPEEVPIVLETVANFYRESAAELESAWQDRSAGKVWDDFATILECAAESCRKALIRRGFTV